MLGGRGRVCWGGGGGRGGGGGGGEGEAVQGRRKGGIRKATNGCVWREMSLGRIHRHIRREIKIRKRIEKNIYVNVDK